MINLTLPSLDNQLNTLELELAQLQQQIAEKKQLKKAIAQKKKLAIKVLESLSNALSQLSETLTELGDSSQELSELALDKISEYFPLKGKNSNLVEISTKTLPSNDLEPKQIPTELKIVPKNWVASPGAIIKKNNSDYTCSLQETDVLSNTGIAKDLKTNATFSIDLEEWAVDLDFYREALFTYQAMIACNSKEELTAINNSNQLNQDFLNFCYIYMPSIDQLKIDKFYKTTPSEAVLKLPSGLTHYKEIAQVVLEEISHFYTITVSKKRAKDVSCWNLIAQSGDKAKLYLGQGFEWSIEPFKKGEELSDCFPEDVADFLAANDVFVDELYDQVA